MEIIELLYIGGDFKNGWIFLGSLRSFLGMGIGGEGC